MFVVPTIGFRLLYGLVIIRLERRQLVWINVTANPTADWIARQITEALAMVDSAIWIPSLSSPPSMRGAPQRGFSRLMRRTRLLISDDRAGRPGGCRDFQRHRSAENARRDTPLRRTGVPGHRSIANISKA